MSERVMLEAAFVRIGLRIFLVISVVFALAVGMSTGSSAQTPMTTVAVLGSEAAPILHLLDPTLRILPLRPGGLAAASQQYHIDALIVPDNWSDSQDREAAQRGGIHIVKVRRHTNTAAILDNIRALGELIGQVDTATGITVDISAAIAALREQSRPLLPTRVLLLTPEGYTQGRETLFTDMIDIAGGVNIAAEAGIPEARQISDTQIRAFAPDVILLVGWSADAASAFVDNPLYVGIPAFDQRRADRITPLGKDPAALVRELRWLHTLLHPIWI